MRKIKSGIVITTILFGGCVSSDVKLTKNYNDHMVRFKNATDYLQNDLQILLFAAKLNINNPELLAACLDGCLEIAELPTDLEQAFAEGIDVKDVTIMRNYNKKLLAEAKHADGEVKKAQNKLSLNYEKYRDSAVVSHGVMKMILIAGSFIGLALLAKFFFHI